MPRLFLGNFDFEHRLADPTRQMPAKLERINAELASSWLAIAEDGDYLWTPQPIEAGFFEQAVRDGLPRVIPVVSFDDVPRGVECVPWGWTDDVRRLCDKHGWIRNDPSDEAVRAGNSRRFSAALEREWLCGLDFAGEATSLQEIERLISFHDPESRWVVKAEFGMSGRERILGCGSPTEADRHWIEKRLAADGVVFFEPWVDRINEVGIQIDIPREGDPQLVGITPIIVDERGQYAGSRFVTAANSSHLDAREAVISRSKMATVAIRAAKRLQERGYFGRLGVDAMRYRAANGNVRLRPLQDINARWTMGRLSLGLCRLLRQGEHGCWLRGPHESAVGQIINCSGPRIGWFRAILESRGLQLTREREAVFDAIFALRGQFDAEVLIDLFRQPEKDPRISRSTVYRTLGLLEEAEMISKVPGLLGDSIYEHDFTGPRRIRTSPQKVGGVEVHHISSVLIYEKDSRES